MDSVRDWDVLTDGAAPVQIERVGFTVTKELLITDADGDHYGVTDGKTVLKLVLVNPSPEKIAADEASALAAKPENDRIKAEFAAAQFWSERISDLPVMNDDEWTQLTQAQRTEHLRNIVVGLLGAKVKANQLLDKEAEGEPGLFSKLFNKFF